MSRKYVKIDKFTSLQQVQRERIERNQKPLAPEITLAVTHHDRQKQVEVKRSSRVNPHEIRLFSGCPYAVVK